MSNLLDLQSQIAKLQAQAYELRQKEFASTVVDIKAKMAAFGITVKDLQAPAKGKGKPGRKPSGGAGKKVKAEKSAKPAVKVEAKYRGPNGETWSGRGLMPKWLAAAVEAGSTKESFLIAPAAEVSAG